VDEAPVFTGDLTGTIQDVSPEPQDGISASGAITGITDPEGETIPTGTFSVSGGTPVGTLSVRSGTYGTFTFSPDTALAFPSIHLHHPLLPLTLS
jgi:hypothetical protein